MRSLAAAACAALAACATAPAIEVPMPEPTPLACTLELSEHAPGALDLAFAITNTSDVEVALEAFHPFVDLALVVAMDGHAVPLVEPSAEDALEPVTHVVPAHGALRVVTPRKLVFDPDVPPGGRGDPDRIAIPRARGAAVIEVTLDFRGRRVGPCRATFTP